MKMNIARAFVLTLAFVGFTATSFSARATASTPQVKVQVAGGPIGMCWPGDPTFCGMH